MGRKFSIIKYKKQRQRLPAEYQEVEYIQSSGAQYIDTGVTVDNKFGYSVDFQPLNTTDSILLGVCGNGSDARWCLNPSSGAINMSWNSINGTVTNDLQRHVCNLNYNNDKKRIVDNSAFSLILEDLSPNASNYNVLMFAAHWRSQAVTLYASAKVYSCKITNDLTLVRDFIPCYRKSDSVAGMYDLVNNVFYINSGTGTFAVGPDSSSFTIKDSIVERRLETTYGLPVEYQEVKYLQSNGSQYINTNYYMTATSSVETKVRVESNANRWCYGSSQDNNFYAVNILNNTNLEYRMVNSGWLAVPLGIDITYADHIISSDNTKLYLDGNELATFTSPLITTSTLPLLIGARTPAASTCFIGKWYYFKIYENNTLIRQFIPCYRKSDNKPGFYETEQGEFYINETTSGDYTIGDSIVPAFKFYIVERRTD